MRQYLALLRKTLGAPLRSDRTGTGTHGIFGPQMDFDLAYGLPSSPPRRSSSVV